VKLPRRQFLHLAAGTVALPALSRIALAQAYPTRPVRIVVGFPPGTSSDIIGRLSWVQHYRPADNPNVARIYHHKTRELVEMPLYDEDDTILWPEMMERLDGAARRGSLIVMRDKIDRKRKIHLPWKEDYFRHRVAEIRTAAGIDQAAKFMGLRHGGNTEGADADLTDAQLRALSGHKTASMTALYAKQTMKQRREGARKRLAARTKGPSL
jgi:hypothetical protein